MTQTHEPKPRRGVIERVIIGLSLSGPRFGGGGGGIPEYTAADYAAASAGYRDPIGRHLVGLYLGDGKSRDGCIEDLDGYGWSLWRRHRRGEISPELHRRMARAAVQEIERGEGWSIREVKSLLQIGQDRWRSLAGHYVELINEIRRQDQQVADHLARRLRRT